MLNELLNLRCQYYNYCNICFPCDRNCNYNNQNNYYTSQNLKDQQYIKQLIDKIVYIEKKHNIDINQLNNIIIDMINNGEISELDDIDIQDLKKRVTKLENSLDVNNEF